MAKTTATVTATATAETVTKGKIHIVESDGCDFCNNKVCDDPVMVLCPGCRQYLNNKMRRRLLVRELGKYGMEIRNDSVMAKKYIRGDEDTGLEDVVNIMLEMNFYLKVTDYRDVVRELVAYYCTEHGLLVGSKIENKDDMKEIKQKAKRIVLDRYVRTGNDIDNVPPSLRDKAEIIALETYIDI